MLKVGEIKGSGSVGRRVETVVLVKSCRSEVAGKHLHSWGVGAGQEWRRRRGLPVAAIAGPVHDHAGL